MGLHEQQPEQKQMQPKMTKPRISPVGTLDIAFKAKCPKCGHETVVKFVDQERFRPKAVLCDSNLGGCDKFFAVRIYSIDVNYKTETINL